jgi:hypothetical protein
VVEEIPDMPPGTVGFRVSERLVREDYVRVLVPPLRQAVQTGERLRVLYAIGPGLHMEPGEMHLFHERELQAAKTWLSA